MSCCFIIGTDKDYKERLDEIESRLKKTFPYVYHIPYDCDTCDFCWNCHYKIDYSLEVLSESADIVFYMDGWSSDSLCDFLYSYAELTDMKYISEPDMSVDHRNIYTTEAGYVMARDEDWSENEVKGMVTQVNNWGYSMGALAQQYETDTISIWRVLDRNRDKLEKVPGKWGW